MRQPEQTPSVSSTRPSGCAVVYRQRRQRRISAMGKESVIDRETGRTQRTDRKLSLDCLNRVLPVAQEITDTDGGHVRTSEQLADLRAVADAAEDDQWHGFMRK